MNIDSKQYSSKELSKETAELLLAVGKSSIGDSFNILTSQKDGLTHKEALARIQKYGENKITQIKPPSWWVQLIKAFITPFTLILIGIGATSYATDILFAEGEKDWTKVVILLTMIILSGTLRFWQEFRSQKEAEKLKALVQNKALVSRKDWNDDNKETKREINVSDLVPGDIVHLSAGDMIPADIRLIESDDFFVSESSLTGESTPVEKFAQPITKEERIEAKKDTDTRNPLELNTLCFLGTNVVSGSATGIIITTGAQTYFGTIAQTIVGERPQTSFDIGVNKTSWILVYFIFVMVPIVFILNGITKNDWHEAFFFALAVAVGITPEMLPLIVTTNLAKGALSMSKKKVVVKRLNAIQNFGAMDIFCTDKTGTITENRVVLVRHLDPMGHESERALRTAYLNSYFQTGLKNLIDQAVIESMEKEFSPERERSYKKIDEVPFDFTRRRMSVIVEKESLHRVLICKGAVEEILERCTHIEIGGNPVPITSLTKEQSFEITQNLNSNGLRVVAVAYKPVPKTKHIYSIEDEQDLILVGYVGFLDPPKASARESIDLLEDHGIRVKIITGDNEIVTARVARDVGLDGDKILLGEEIALLSDKELVERVEDISIFAKIAPAQKARIIEALKQCGHTVGFMGDGINDAPAMRVADVGVSVDTAVDIAKDAADIILLKNDLHVLDEGVIEGRTVFGNILKYIKMASSSNFGNMLSILVASVALPFLPMLPVQILIQNLLYDISQISIPWDHMDAEFLKTPRKWEAGGITRFMLLVGPTSSVFDIITYVVLWFVFSANTIGAQSFFQTGWFIEGLVSQVLIVHMIRTQKIPFIQSRASLPVLLMTTMIIFLGIAIPFTKLGAGIGLTQLPLVYFAILALILVNYIGLVHVVKMLYIRKYKSWL